MGDFDFQVSYTMLTNIDGFSPDQDESGAGLFAFGGEGVFVARMPGAVLDLPGPQGIYAAADGDTTFYGYTLTLQQSGKLRMTRVGNVYSFYYWGTDDWILVGSGTSPRTGPADLHLAVAADGDATVSAAFDNFYLQADGFVAEGRADCILPHITDGSGWSTRISLVNMDTVPATYTLMFYHDDGSNWTLPLKGQVASNVYSGVIPVGGSVLLETLGSSGANEWGWAHLDTNNKLSGMAVFKVGWMPSNDAEAVVPFSNKYDCHYFMPFDNRNGYVTSLALVNPSTSRSDHITLTFRDPDGVLITQETIDFTAGQHRAFGTTNRYPATEGKSGTIEFSGADEGVPALGLLFNPRYSFTSIIPLSP